MKHKKLFITFTVIFSVLVALTIFFMIWFWGDRYDDFKDFRSESAIPGLNDGACPQGITNYRVTNTITKTDSDGNKTEIKKQDYFFISAYFKNGPSRIYVIGSESGEIGYVTLLNTDGSDHIGHVGGIATNGRYLWVGSDDTVYVARYGKTNSDNVALDIIEKAEKHGSVKFTNSFKANCGAAFLYYYDADQNGAAGTPSASDYLYVGEFYRAGNYDTTEKHHLTTKNGETNRAFAYEYRVSNSTSDDSVEAYGLYPSEGIGAESKLAVPEIKRIFSLPDEIQGFARTANGIVLSRSYGLKNSHIYYYSFDWNTRTENSYEIYNKIDKLGFKYDGATTKTSTAPYYDRSSSLYVYYLDRSSMLNDYSIPSMSEGLCTLEGRVYVLFESGAKKYSPFVRQVLKNVYSFIPRKSEKS